VSVKQNLLVTYTCTSSNDRYRSRIDTYTTHTEDWKQNNSSLYKIQTTTWVQSNQICDNCLVSQDIIALSTQLRTHHTSRIKIYYVSWYFWWSWQHFWCSITRSNSWLIGWDFIKWLRYLIFL